MITAKTEARRKRDEAFRKLGEAEYRRWVKLGRMRAETEQGEDFNGLLVAADAAVQDVALQ